MTADDLADGGGSLTLAEDGQVAQPWALIDLDHGSSSPGALKAAARAAKQATQVLIGVSETSVSPDAVALASQLAFSLTPASTQVVPQSFVPVPDVSRALELCEESMSRCPTAGLTLMGLLRLTSRLPVREGLIAESLAYSMLLAGSEFTRWLASRSSRQSPQSPEQDLVALRRTGEHLFVELNRPGRHNAFSHGLRDALIDALELARLDSSIRVVHLSGSGPSFCSGGDIYEFGTAGDVSIAHLVRQNQNAGAVLHSLRQQVRVVVHGACIGAGVELPAFASHIEAHEDAYFQLPEVRMGLIPGAGGTVSITRRIGRWRTAYLGLTGQPVDVSTALAWGLVDARADVPSAFSTPATARPSSSAVPTETETEFA